MKKKKLFYFFVGLLIVFGFVNLSFDNKADLTSLNFENVEALAAEESSSSNKVSCITVGTICVGINVNNQVGKFPGLRYAN